MGAENALIMVIFLKTGFRLNGSQTTLASGAAFLLVNSVGGSVDSLPLPPCQKKKKKKELKKTRKIFRYVCISGITTKSV